MKVGAGGGLSFYGYSLVDENDKQKVVTLKLQNHCCAHFNILYLYTACSNLFYYKFNFLEFCCCCCARQMNKLRPSILILDDMIL